ncbi:MAG TPA: N-acetylmuramoyl-L-alanine amidase [Rhizomicrobium sp.]|nr:N-acetylmuramoyl-L-alanine amidase [Rhizomicrobium sp.]
MMAYRLVECPSPNHDARDADVDMLVLHYTGMKTADEALARLTDPAAKVSAHYTIGRDGRVYRHVPEERRAWHAGVSYWAGARNINARSIGIELVNPGHEFGYVPFTDEQIAALIDIAQEIMARHNIPPTRVVGHSDVAPARKEDPGELFPWRALAEYGIGLWPEGGVQTAPQNALRQFGYGLPPDVEWTEKDVVRAFQRRFRPKKLDGLWDVECSLRLASLLAQARAMS